MSNEPMTATEAAARQEATLIEQAAQIGAVLDRATGRLFKRVRAMLSRKGPGGWHTRDAAASEEDG